MIGFMPDLNSLPVGNTFSFDQGKNQDSEAVKILVCVPLRIQSPLSVRDGNTTGWLNVTLINRLRR